MRRVGGDDQEPGQLLTAASAHESLGLAGQVVGVVQFAPIIGSDLAVLVDTKIVAALRIGALPAPPPVPSGRHMGRGALVAVAVEVLAHVARLVARRIEPRGYRRALAPVGSELRPPSRRRI